jgi:hypothetical protein
MRKFLEATKKTFSPFASLTCNLHFTRAISIFALTLSYQVAVRWQAEIIQSERRRMTFAINYSEAFNSLWGGTSYPIMMFRY